MSPAFRTYALILVAVHLLGACRGLDPVASEELARGAGEAATLSPEQSIRPPSTRAIEAAVNNPAPPAR